VAWLGGTGEHESTPVDGDGRRSPRRAQWRRVDRSVPRSASERCSPRNVSCAIQSVATEPPPTCALKRLDNASIARLRGSVALVSQRS
jgi:hypothetical protein